MKYYNQRKRLKIIRNSVVCKLKENINNITFGTREEEKKENTGKVFGVEWKDVLDKTV
jgi:hypothetical protein